MAKKFSGSGVKDPIVVPSEEPAKRAKTRTKAIKAKDFDLEADSLPEAIIDAAREEPDAARLVEGVRERIGAIIVQGLVPVKLAALLRGWPEGRTIFFADESGGVPAAGAGTTGGGTAIIP